LLDVIWPRSETPRVLEMLLKSHELAEFLLCPPRRDVALDNHSNAQECTPIDKEHLVRFITDERTS
jgi:hypothetical protein